MIISQHRLPLERRAVASAKRSQEAWQRGEMIGWRQQVVGDQRVEEMLGRQARCPKNVPQGGDDEARRKPSTDQLCFSTFYYSTLHLRYVPAPLSDHPVNGYTQGLAAARGHRLYRCGLLRRMPPSRAMLSGRVAGRAKPPPCHNASVVPDRQQDPAVSEGACAQALRAHPHELLSVAVARLIFRTIPRPTRCEHMLRKSKQSGDFRVASIEMSTFYAVLGVRPHTVCNRNLDTRTGQGDLGS